MNSLVLVYKKTRSWTDLYKLLSIEEEFPIVSLPSRPTKFQTMIVKPYPGEVQEKDEKENRMNIETLGSHNNDGEMNNRERSV